VTAAKELGKFLAKYESAIVRQAKTNLAKPRKLLPGAIEMAYDNFLVTGFGPSEKPSLAIFTPVLSPDYMNLRLVQGKGLPDPAKRVQGSGNLVRNIRLSTEGGPLVQSKDKATLRGLSLQSDPHPNLRVLA